jgi:transforming growth factor-beta-induced protein
MKLTRTIVTLGAVMAVAVAAVGGSATAATKQDRTIVETAVAAGQFNTLAQLLTSAGLVETLQGPGPFTVFAPTDAAFAKVPQSTLNALLADPAKLREVLLYHVVPGRVLAQDVVRLSSAQTAAGKPVRIRVMGSDVYVNESKVIATDVMASNGVIHVIDSVLIPPAAATPKPKPKTIAQTAAAAGQFKTLTMLLKRAGLAGTLNARGPYTVFAPTDAAFKQVPRSTLNALLADRAKLRAVLLYHVVPGKVTSSRVVKLRAAKTAGGQNVHVRVAGKRVFINNARVTKADVSASNGVIHVVNRVLIPPAR